MNMKMSLAALILTVAPLGAYADDHEKKIEIKTESKNGATHWGPARIEVKQGDVLKIHAKHELEGGFDFHGLKIPALGVTKQVNRNKELVVEAKVPADLKPGEYPIGCHFHPAHVGATLVVAAADEKAMNNKDAKQVEKKSSKAKN